MRKSKEVEVNLYNFDAHNEDRKPKKSKNNSNVKRKQTKKSKKVKDKNEDTLFSFDNEIVIGLPKRETKNVKSASKNKKIKNKKSKINEKSKKAKTKKAVQNSVPKKTKKTISKKQEEIKKQKRIKKLKIVKYVFLLICILVAIIATMTSPLFNIKEITVEGNEKISTDEITSLSQIEIDENTYKVNMRKVKDKILENPYIKTVTIERKLPSCVKIIIEERETTYMIEYGGGYVYINNQGYILEVSSEKLEVPIIQGAETTAEEFVPGNRLCNNDLEKMSSVIKIMEAAENNDIANLITRIDIENKQNYKIVLESEQKVAYLGDDTDLSTKMLSIKAIIEKESGIAGDIFVNIDLKDNYPTFRQSV